MEDHRLHQSPDAGESTERQVKNEEDQILVRKTPLQSSPDSREGNVKTEEEDEVIFLGIKERKIPLQISPDGKCSQNQAEERADFSSDSKREEEIASQSTGDQTTPTPHRGPSQLSTHLNPSLPVPHHTSRPSNTFSCSICGKCFTVKFDLIRHERDHVAENTVREDVRSKPIPVRRENRTPVRRETRLYSCTKCQQCFTRKRDCIVHEQSHNRKLYGCTICGRCFTKKVMLMSHWSVHKEKKLHTCSKCGQHFTYKLDLYAHRSAHKNNSCFS